MKDQTKKWLEYADDERDLIDSIYLPSKYPIGSVLPEFEPDMPTCQQCIAVAERVRGSVTDILSKVG